MPMADLDALSLRSELGFERRNGWVVQQWGTIGLGEVELLVVPHIYLVDADGKIKIDTRVPYDKSAITVDNAENFIFPTEEDAKTALEPVSTKQR